MLTTFVTIAEFLTLVFKTHGNYSIGDNSQVKREFIWNNL